MSTHLTDHPDAPIYDAFSQIHRAVVQYSSTTTGEIKVVIPSVTGIYKSVPISYFGREAHPFENDWVVPNVGSSIIVCREDEDYKQVFWINTTYNPVRADVGEANPPNYNFGPAGSESTFDLVDFAETPTSSGLYLGSVNMGYYKAGSGAGWKTYMDYNGNFYLGGTGGSLQWNGTTLTISGNITILNPSAVRTTLNVADGAQANSSSQDNPPNYSFGGDATFDLNAVPAEGSINSAGLYLGSNNLGYHDATVWKSYMDSSGRFYLGGTSGSLQWDGSTLTILGSAVIGGTAASTVVTGAASGASAVQDGDGSLNLTLTDGAVGGWVITTGLLTGGTGSHKIELDQGNKRISAGGGRAVMLAESSGRVAIGIDADAGNAPAYNSSGGDVVMERTSGGTPRFSCGNKLTWDGTTLSVTGNIVVGSTTLSEGAILNSELAGAAGRTHIGLPNVSNETPQNQAQTGLTSGVTISAGGITMGSGGAIMGGQDAYDAVPVGTTSGFFLGYSGGTHKFSIGNPAGNKLTWNGSALTITGAITASAISGSTIEIGTSNTILKVDTAGNLSIGHATPSSAPFKVSNAGVLTATSATITGDITATTGTFTGTVNATGGNFTGTVTGGTMQGGTIQTAASGARLVLDPNSGSVPSGTANAFIQGWTGNTNQHYPGFVYFGDATGTTGSVVIAAPRFTATIAYAGMKASHTTTSGRGSVELGLPNYASQFNISDTSGTLYTWVAAGNFGVGTATPGDQLHVYEAGTGAAWRGRALFGGQTNVVVAGEYNGVASIGAHNAALNAWATLVINEGGGNVGIGTASPTRNLSLNGTNSYISFNEGDVEGWVFGYEGGSNNRAILYGGTPGGTRDYRQTWLDNGNVGIGFTNPGYKLSVNGTFWSNLSMYAYAGGYAVGWLPWSDNTYNLGGGISSSRWKNGYFSNNVYTHDGGVHVSDVAEKTDVADAVLGLAFVNAVRPVTYKWIATESRPGARTHHGFIAQEIAAVLGDDADNTALWCNAHQPAVTDDDAPEGSVSVEESYTQSLRYTEFIPILTKAIQDLSTKLEAAESRIAALEAS